ncbi:MogA/MoaB family molybdenum cofactor biosynthesis protein [Halorhabdus amylolytica]|uniref:MogA/MoaB family molybdenum cofactor biosynthesis protein n=1 Tax=Halorhabdus amylolytica TaxID=2559573 RepID=UPI0010A9A193|nr:MogA/MoaB family molybdenum cofactor biosynthesis protein [Halorhabdus amylolytica]
MSHHHDHDISEVGIALITISTSRTLENDSAGDAIAAAVEDAGATVVERRLIEDDADAIEAALLGLVDAPEVDAVVTTGGTGITPDDVTIDVANRVLEIDLPGFGEEFRRRSFEEVGTRAMATRATAGVLAGVPVFCLPGSENAARLGIEELILPEIAHLVAMATR